MLSPLDTRDPLKIVNNTLFFFFNLNEELNSTGLSALPQSFLQFAEAF